MDYFSQAKLNMVRNQIAPNGVFNENILDSFLSIPRDLFIPNDWKEASYLDRSIPLTAEREIPKPDTLAKIIQLTNPLPEHHVLDIACGSGYSTAILSKLVSKVISVENITSLSERANHNLKLLKIKNAVVENSDLKLGFKKEAPFNSIIVNAIVPIEEHIKTLIEQLKIQGVLVCWELLNKIPYITTYHKIGHNNWKKEFHFQSHNSNSL